MDFFPFIVDAMLWDPFGTFWIGGGQWAGKSTVARILAHRYGLTAYHFDYQNVHAHYDRRLARSARAGETVADPDPEDMWIRHAPGEMAAQVLADFQTGFDWVLDDLRALVSGNPIIAEGWGIRPELVAEIGLADRMLVMVPTDEFRAYQLRTMERAQTLHTAVSDSEKGQRNRLERDSLITADAVESARNLRIPVIEVDGSRDAEGVADVVAAQFRLG